MDKYMHAGSSDLLVSNTLSNNFWCYTAHNNTSKYTVCGELIILIVLISNAVSVR